MFVKKNIRQWVIEDDHQRHFLATTMSGGWVQKSIIAIQDYNCKKKSILLIIVLYNNWITTSINWTNN